MQKEGMEVLIKDYDMGNPDFRSKESRDKIAAFPRSGNGYSAQIQPLQHGHIGVDSANLRFVAKKHDIVVARQHRQGFLSQRIFHQRGRLHWMQGPQREIHGELPFRHFFDPQYATTGLKGKIVSRKSALLKEHMRCCQGGMTAQIHFNHRCEPA